MAYGLGGNEGSEMVTQNSALGETEKEGTLWNRKAITLSVVCVIRSWAVRVEKKKKGKRRRGRCNQPLTWSIRGVDSFGIWLLPTMFTWHLTGHFNPKVQSSQHQGGLVGCPREAQTPNYHLAGPATGTGNF